jgi:hypothetical protein
MKSLNDDGFGLEPLAQTRSRRRKLLTTAAILALTLILSPLAVLAGTHGKSPRWRYDAAATADGAAAYPAILPPPDEPPPPPPPREVLTSDYSCEATAEDFGGSRSPHGFDADAGCGQRVLDLPQLLRFHKPAVATARAKYSASPLRNYDELQPRDYSDDLQMDEASGHRSQ